MPGLFYGTVAPPERTQAAPIAIDKAPAGPDGRAYVGGQVAAVRDLNQRPRWMGLIARTDANRSSAKRSAMRAVDISLSLDSLAMRPMIS